MSNVMVRVILAAGAAATICPAQVTDPRTFLSDALKPFVTLTTYKADVGICYADMRTQQCEEVRRVVWAWGAHDRRIEQYAPHPFLTIFSGQKVRRYSADLRQYREETVENHVEPVEISSLQFLARVEILSARFLSDEVLALGGNSYECKVVEATGRLKPGQPIATVTVYVDSTGLPRRMITVGGTKIVASVIYSLDVNAPVSSADFVGPAGATLVPDLQLPPRDAK